jgi:cytochrome b
MQDVKLLLILLPASHNMYPLWDLPTRLFHWLLVLAIFASWLSYELEWINVHLWSGYTVLVLAGFRLAWGVVGSAHSRFSDFMLSPVAVWRYWRGADSTGLGHNPAGGWAVLLMLLLILAQAVSGLFNSDGLLFEGPLYHALDSDWTDKLGALHAQGFWALLGFITLHIAAVLYYQFGSRAENLIGPMFTGGDGGQQPPVSLWRALVVLVLCGAVLAAAVYWAPAPELPW